MTFPWWRLLNLLLDFLAKMLRERVNSKVEKRADVERAKMKTENSRGGP